MSQSLRLARDELLALRCQLSEPGAFADLVREMERPLLYFARQLVGDDQQAQDIVQEVWIRALRSIRRLREPRQLRSWLYQQARSLVVDSQRQQYSRAARELNYAAEQPLVEDPSESVFSAEDTAAVHAGLQQLDLLHREVLVLHFLEELTIAEMAVIVDCPEGTIKSRMHHAKRALRAILETKHD